MTTEPSGHAAAVVLPHIDGGTVVLAQWQGMRCAMRMLVGEPKRGEEGRATLQLSGRRHRAACCHEMASGMDSPLPPLAATTMQRWHERSAARCGRTLMVV